MEMAKYLFLCLLLFAAEFFAQQDTISYKLSMRYKYPLGSNKITMEQGYFVEGEKYIIPVDSLVDPLDPFNDFYNSIEKSAFWMDNGAIDENIFLDITLDGLDNATGWPEITHGHQLFLYLTIEVYTMPDSILVPGDYNFAPGKYIHFAIPKHEAFLAGLDTLGMEPDSLGFRYIINGGYDSTGIQTINEADTVQFRALHLSKFGGGRGRLPTNPPSKMIENVPGIPEKYNLEQNYPNPFNPSTSIMYSLPKSGLVELKIYDITGAEVGTLINDYQNAGVYKVVYSAENLSSGIYIYELRSGDTRLSKKMLYLK